MKMTDKEWRLVEQVRKLDRRSSEDVMRQADAMVWRRRRSGRITGLRGLTRGQAQDSCRRAFRRVMRLTGSPRRKEAANE